MITLNSNRDTITPAKIPMAKAFQSFSFYRFFDFSITLSNRLSIHTLKSVVINFPSKNRLKIVAGLGAFWASSIVLSLMTFKGRFRFSAVSTKEFLA